VLLYAGGNDTPTAQRWRFVRAECVCNAHLAPHVSHRCTSENASDEHQLTDGGAERISEPFFQQKRKLRAAFKTSARPTPCDCDAVVVRSVHYLAALNPAIQN
jgi:hypothetical protein